MMKAAAIVQVESLISVSVRSAFRLKLQSKLWLLIRGGYLSITLRSRSEQHRLTGEQNRIIVLFMFFWEGLAMLRMFVEEAAALTSISLFVGMIAVWAQLVPQL